MKKGKWNSRSRTSRNLSNKKMSISKKWIKNLNKPKKSSGTFKKSTTTTISLNLNRPALSKSITTARRINWWKAWAEKANIRISTLLKSVPVQRRLPWVLRTERHHLLRARSSASSQSNPQTLIYSARKIASVRARFPNNLPWPTATRIATARQSRISWIIWMGHQLATKKAWEISFPRFQKITRWLRQIPTNK